MTDFPTDETTLTLLIAACEINPDTGRSHLMDFLEMGARVKSETLIEDGEGTDWGDAPTYLVEHEEGYEPFSPQDVIATLAREVFAGSPPQETRRSRRRSPSPKTNRPPLCRGGLPAPMNGREKG